MPWLLVTDCCLETFIQTVSNHNRNCARALQVMGQKKPAPVYEQQKRAVIDVRSCYKRDSAPHHDSWWSYAYVNGFVFIPVDRKVLLTVSPTEWALHYFTFWTAYASFYFLCFKFTPQRVRNTPGVNRDTPGTLDVSEARSTNREP